MTLISLLIALAVERVMVSKQWNFNFYYRSYLNFARGFVSKGEISKNKLNVFVFALVPALVVWVIISVVDSRLIEFIIATAGLIICFGSDKIRSSYKSYLNAAMRGDEVAVDLYQQELQQNQTNPKESYGQTLVWLNYQYYMAILLLFICVGIGGVIFYRILITVANNRKNEEGEVHLPETAVKHARDILHYIDLIPVRFVAFGYMLVGHFSKASKVWLEGLLNFTQPPREYLCDVAKTSEDIVFEQGDLTAEPTILVSLAKRNVLLLLAAVACLTLAEVLI